MFWVICEVMKFSEGQKINKLSNLSDFFYLKFLQIFFVCLLKHSLAITNMYNIILIAAVSVFKCCSFKAL